jgi:outer membrane protein
MTSRTVRAISSTPLRYVPSRLPRLPSARRLPRVVLGALFGAASIPLHAEEIPRSDSPRRPAIDLGVENGPKLKLNVVLGASVTSAGEYPGSDKRSVSLQPVGALRVGRLRFATSGGGALLDFGADSEISGVSLDLLQSSSRWRLRTGMRISGGRDSGDSEDLAGIPDVRRTLLGRISASYAVTPAWNVGSTLSADLLGRGTGLFLSSGADWRHRLTGSTEFRFGAGFTVANAVHMSSYYGVPESAGTERRPAYAAGAGLKDAGVSIGLTTAISPSWIAFGGLSYTRLLGDAADSPLAHKQSDFAGTLGIAWRFRR